ncbi:MAG: PDZ domain-containing protein [Pseudomonadota bacterium]
MDPVPHVVRIHCDRVLHDVRTGTASPGGAVSGTGVVVDVQDGEHCVLTCYRLVEGAAEARVVVPAVPGAPAVVCRVAAVHPHRGLAVLCGRLGPVAPAPIHPDWLVAPGSPVRCVGYDGAAQRVVDGAVPGYDAERGLLVLAAGVDPALSGAAVLDKDGALVGTLCSPDDETVVCVPVIFYRAMTHLGAGETTLSDAELGVAYQPMTPHMVAALSRTGVVVTSIVPGSAAAAGGLQTMDVITGLRIDDTDLPLREDGTVRGVPYCDQPVPLRDVLRFLLPRRTRLVVDVYRVQHWCGGGQKLSLQLLPFAPPARTGQRRRVSPGLDAWPTVCVFGARFRSLRQNLLDAPCERVAAVFLANPRPHEERMMVTCVHGGVAEACGVRVGDLVVAVNGTAVRTPEDLIAALDAPDCGGTVLVVELEYLQEKKYIVVSASAQGEYERTQHHYPPLEVAGRW